MRYVNVIVINAPVSERYWTKGCDGQLDKVRNEIRVGGCWFDYDERWDVYEEGTVAYQTWTTH